MAEESKAVLDLKSLGISNEKNLDFVSKGGGDYLAYVKLMTAGSGKCKDGEFEINAYAHIKDQVHTNIGKEVDALIIAVRSRATEFGSEVINVFDPKLDENDEPTGEFKRIADKSDVRDSGCVFGGEFLCWFPIRKEFATVFFNTKSSRREIEGIKKKVGSFVTFKAKFIETRGVKSYKYWSPIAISCSTQYDLPDLEQIKRVAIPFINPPERTEETIETGEASSTRVR